MWHLFDSERQLIKVPSDLCHHVLCIYPAGAVHNSPWQILLFLLQNFIISIKTVNDAQGLEVRTACVNTSCSSDEALYVCGRNCMPSALVQAHQYPCSASAAWGTVYKCLDGSNERASCCMEIQSQNPSQTVLRCVTTNKPFLWCLPLFLNLWSKTHTPSCSFKSGLFYSWGLLLPLHSQLNKLRRIFNLFQACV